MKSFIIDYSWNSDLGSVEQSGYNAPETGEVCYYYGNALMHLSREKQETGDMFGEAITEIIDKEAEARGIWGHSRKLIDEENLKEIPIPKAKKQLKKKRMKK